ncbi:hypothetical protein GCM10007913_36860 [Devosia yakushimensis]|uniref:DUF4440 domain-containing protein n=1 Tax=Devosia yakushimensis TaxID=470028 RepID=A0ABQ5UKT0_9HYPH|nr:hypothetical protein [Devosia yakushimensis]GLQ11754.1 hypothetical protein GCM10007913_36860 [Devosia yakushimensis]
MRIFAAALTLILTVSPALAQTDDDVFAALEGVYGIEEAGNFDAYFTALTAAFAEDDRETVAAMGGYPFEVAANGELYDILAPEDLIANFDALLLPETIEAIAGQDYADLIVTDEGVGFANGALWLANVCADEACASSDWLITRITN